LLCVIGDVDRETEDNLIDNSVMFASYAGTERGDEGMALKIRTRAEDTPDGFGTL